MSVFLFLYKLLKLDKIAFYFLSFEGLGLLRYRPVQLLFNFIIMKIKTDFVEINNQKIYLDYNDSLCLSLNKKYEFLEYSLIRKYLQKDNVVFDIGAHIGYYTLNFASLVGDKGKVFSFEPNPTNFTLLKKNVEINNHNNVNLFQKAISNFNGNIRLYISDFSSGMHRIHESKFCNDFIEIESVRLDDFVKNHEIKKIDFLKIDVEGAEFDVLKGMTNIIHNNKSLKILVEFSPYSITEHGSDPIEFLKNLINHGFQLYDIDEKKQIIKNTDLDALQKKYTVKKMNYTNLFCMR